MRAVVAILVILAAGAAGVFFAVRDGDSYDEGASEERVTVEVRPLPSSVGGARVTAADIAPRGTVALGTASGELWFQDRGGGAPERRATRVGDGSPIARVAFSAGGTALGALTRNGWLWVWEVGTAIAATSRLHPSVLDEMDAIVADPDTTPIAVSPDGGYVATAAFNVVLFDLDERRHRVFVQELDPESYGGEFRTGAPFDALAVTGTEVVAANVSGIDTWRTGGGRARPVFKCGCDPNGASVGANGEVVTYGTGDGHAMLFDVGAQEELSDKTISTERPVFTASAAWPPRRAAAVGDPNRVTIFDPADGETLAVASLPKTPTRVALSADGQTVLAEADNRRWRLILR